MVTLLSIICILSLTGNIVLWLERMRRQYGPQEPESLGSGDREAEESPRPTRPLHTFSTRIGSGLQASYWDRKGDPEEAQPTLALYFERDCQHMAGAATIRVPGNHYLLMDGSFPPRIVPARQFHAEYQPAKVAFTAGEPKFQSPTRSRTTLYGGKIELPQEEIDKIVAEHEFLATLWKQEEETREELGDLVGESRGAQKGGTASE